MAIEESSSPSISRKIYFYLIKWKTDQKDEICTNELFFNTVIAASHEEGSRIIIQEGDIERAELVQETPPPSNANHGHFKLKRVRRKDTPIEEYDDTGELYPYNPDEKRVFSEPSHFIVVDGAIVISELNVNGFRTRPYLYQVLRKGLNNLISGNKNTCNQNNIIDFSIIPISEKDFKNKLREIDRVKWLRLNVAPDYGHILSASRKSIIKRLHLPKSIEKASVTILFSVGRKKETKRKFNRAFNAFRKSILEGAEFQEEFLNSLVVSGFKKNGEIVKVDLVEDFLHVEMRAAKMSNRRGVDTADMFEKLEIAYTNNKIYIDEFIHPSR